MFTLHYAKKSDYEAMLKIYRPYIEKTTISFEYTTPSLDVFTKRISALDDKYPVIICKNGDEVVGFAYGSPAFERMAYTWSADLSVYVREDMRGNGIGRQLMQSVLAVLKAQGYRKVYSLVTGENTASVAFHERLGFKIVAEFKEQGYKFNKWLSVYWLEYELNGQEVGQAFPKKLSELGNSVEQFIK
jgi:phosphinothricin acetyltransferase